MRLLLRFGKEPLEGGQGPHWGSQKSNEQNLRAVLRALQVEAPRYPRESPTPSK